MKKFRKTGTAFICMCIVICLISEYEKISLEISDALILWTKVLIPSLFPYLVLSGYLVSSGALDIFSPLLKVICKIFNISKNCSEVYIVSLISGYPCGAICTNEMFSENAISKNEAERLVCFTNNAGPLFLISAVGTNMLSSTKDGVALYLIQVLSAALIGVFIGLGKKEHTTSGTKFTKRAKPFTKCCEDSINTMLKIGAFVVLCSIIGTITIIFFEKLPFTKNSDISIIRCLVYYILEISNAMKYISDFGNSPIVFAFICSSASWAGICVILQIKGVLWEGFPPKKIICSRFAQSFISFIMGFIYKSFSGYSFSFKNENITVFSLILCFIIFASLIFAKKKNYHF